MNSLVLHSQITVLNIDTNCKSFVKDGVCYSHKFVRVLYCDSLFLSLLLSSSVFSPVVFPESSLTPRNLSTVLDVMSDGRWERFGCCVNTPASELQRIKGQYTSDRKCKQALVYSFISSHPAPSWSLVAWALYQTEYLGNQDGSCLKALDLLQQLFPTGTVCS